MSVTLVRCIRILGTNLPVGKNCPPSGCGPCPGLRVMTGSGPLGSDWLNVH